VIEALRITCTKNVKFKFIKIRTGCHYIRYLHYSENLNWAACGLDIAGLNAPDNTETSECFCFLNMIQSVSVKIQACK